MTPEEVLCALDALAVQTGSLACLGCGHEHNCGIHGCAIIREAAKTIRGLSSDNRALRYAIKPAKVKRSQEQEFNGAVAYLRAMIKEQMAQIEKVEAENAALREKVPQWISVAERLPTDHSKKCLITFKDAGGSIVDAAWYIPALGWECCNWDVPQDVITHWMPLPGVPEV